MTKEWRNEIRICPLNKRVHFLIQYHNRTYECIGTLSLNNYTGGIIRGECIEGSSEIFYNGTIIAWAEYKTNEEAEALL